MLLRFFASTRLVLLDTLLPCGGEGNGLPLSIQWEGGGGVRPVIIADLTILHISKTPCGTLLVHTVAVVFWCVEKRPAVGFSRQYWWDGVGNAIPFFFASSRLALLDTLLHCGGEGKTPPLHSMERGQGVRLLYFGFNLLQHTLYILLQFIISNSNSL